MIARYRRATRRKIQQSLILRDIEIPEVYSTHGVKARTKFVEYTWLVVLNQDCDLDLDHHARAGTSPSGGKPVSNDKLLRSVISCPAFPSDQVLAGVHLKPLVTTDGFKGTEEKMVLANRHERYHYLPADPPLVTVDLILDFKLVVSCPPDYLLRWLKKFPAKRVAVLNPPYRDRLSQRFANYFTRIAEPA